MASFQFDSTGFELAHGRAPRGRGSWAFLPAGANEADPDAYVWAPGSCTFTEAKRWVRATQAPGLWMVAS